MSVLFGEPAWVTGDSASAGRYNRSGGDMNLPGCDECRASIVDYIEAWRALNLEMVGTRLASGQELAEAVRQARRLRTEEDVVLAEELFPSIQLNSSHTVRLALSRMLAHETRSGHKVRKVLREIRGN